MDTIFKALNDATRRALLDALRRRDGQTLQDLQSGSSLSRFGVMKHLKVLEEAGLIVSRRNGRFKHHYLNPAPLQQVIDRWIEPLIARPAARALLDFKTTLEGNAMPLDAPRPDLVLSTYIDTTHDRLWEALTRGDLIARYHFAAQAVSGDFAEGATLAYSSDNGEKVLTNRVLSITPKTRIEMEFTPFWPPHAGHTSRCIYLIAPSGAQMRLTVEHYDLPRHAAGIHDGWTRFLSGLKTWLETGKTVRFSPRTT